MVKDSSIKFCCKEFEAEWMVTIFIREKNYELSLAAKPDSRDVQISFCPWCGSKLQIGQ